MTNPLGTAAPVLPLELLQPLDAANPVSTPVPLGGPEQRLVVTPDPGVGDESLLPPSQLLISKDGQSRSIWPVHLAGWQDLGWQLQTDAAAPEPEQPEPEQPEPVEQPEPEGTTEPEPASDSSSVDETAPALTEPPNETATGGATDGDDGGEALLSAEPPDFQAMTKAQIVEYCSTIYGVELDSSQTKAELIEQATALENQSTRTSAEDLAALELDAPLL